MRVLNEANGRHVAIIAFDRMGRNQNAVVSTWAGIRAFRVLTLSSGCSRIRSWRVAAITKRARIGYYRLPRLREPAMTDQVPTKDQLAEENAILRERVTQLKHADESMKQLEWLMQTDENFEFGAQKDERYRGQRYGDLVQLNTDRTIADSVGQEILSDIAGDYLDLLGSSGAIYEKNGDYALGIFSSGWCRFMDQAARDQCDTDDDAEALNSGKWHCHESCWGCSKESMETGQPADVECNGGIRLYAVPVVAGGEVVGSINFGYSDPPKDDEKLHELSLKYGVDQNVLREKAHSYQSRPPFIVELAKRRLQTAAKLIGEIVARKRAEQILQDQAEELARFNKLVVGREQRVIELKRKVNELSQKLGQKAPYDLSFAEE
jgi:ligand-binding sensor protein